jgi:hypothetical protein
MLLDRSENGLQWRLKLIDEARHTLDLQYLFGNGDTVDASGSGLDLHAVSKESVLKCHPAAKLA